MTNDNQTFQVDLAGVVEVFSNHLYSGPHVYLRELIQNAVDAVAAAGEEPTESSTPATSAQVVIEPADATPDGAMYVHDRGVGLDQHDVHAFLSTIGRSSKRDDLGLARVDQIGRFGIGLLAAFMVADEIEVFSHKSGAEPVLWVGRADGTYQLRVGAEVGGVPDFVREWLDQGPGTSVRLLPRPGAADLTGSERAVKLARRYAALVPQRIAVREAAGEVRIAPTSAPWHHRGEEFRVAAIEFAQEHLGEKAPFQVLPVRVPQADLKGMLVIAGGPSSVARTADSRAYVKGMLVSERNADLLPDWAFFARAVVDATLLTPTASREDLYRDELLAEVRESLGEQLRAWLIRLATIAPESFGRFLQLHLMAVLAMALVDEELRDLVVPRLPLESNQGRTTLSDLARTTDTIYFTHSVEDFRRVSAVAAAQGLAVVNGGYAYLSDLLEQSADTIEGAQLRPIDAAALQAHVHPIAEERLRQVGAVLERIREVVDRLDADVELCSFAPDSVPALYVDDPQWRRQRQSEAVAAQADDTWAAILGAVAELEVSRPRLLLNDASPLVRRVLETGEEHPELAELAVEGLYSRALLSGNYPLRAADSVALDRSFLGLLEYAVEGTETRAGSRR